MIQLTVNDNVILWYNEKFHSNIVQLPLCKSETKTSHQEDESVMVQNIIEIFRKNQNFSTLLYPIIKGVQSFSQLRIAVKRRIRQLQKTTAPIDSIHEQNSLFQHKNEPIPHEQRKNHFRKPSIEWDKKRPDTSTPTQFTSKTLSSVPAKGRNKCFLLQETQKLQQNKFIQQFNYCETQKRKSSYNQRRYQTSNGIEASSSQWGQSSNVSSNQVVKESGINKDCFRPWKSFHQITFKLNALDDPDMFRKKECGYKNLAIYQANEKSLKKQISLKEVNCQQNRQLHVSPSFRTTSPNHAYKPCQSFSSTKPLSLKSTTGTLKKTREFKTMFHQLLIAKRETIKEESDENYKNSNNYSVQTIKEEQKEEQKQQSLTVSQDFNQLFSARQSNECDQQNEKRQIQFEQILWGGQ